MSENDTAAGAPEPTDPQRTRSDAWDRVGQYLESMGELGQGLAQRNLDVWKRVAGELRTSPYTAETMSTTTARLVQAAIDNVEDVWTAMSRPPDSRSTARVLPTALLVFGRPKRGTTLVLPSPVYVAVPRAYSGLPEKADVAFDAGGTSLADRVSARLEGHSYVVEGVNAKGPLPATGTYRGSVYVAGAALPLADLVVVVRDLG